MNSASFAIPILGVSLASFVIRSSAMGQELALLSGKLETESLGKLDNPWAMEYLPDGRLLITEKPGSLRVYQDGRLSSPMAGVPKVVFEDQGGLLDVAVDPDFAQNQFIYLSYSEAAEEQPAGAKNEKDLRLGDQNWNDVVLKGLAVARGRFEGDQLKDVKVIWRAKPKTIGRGHFGARLVFAPDGKLFITSGDRQRFEPAQDLGSTLGKVVRINSDGSIPDDNPFVDQTGALPEIWSYGHRNPLGAAINPSSKGLWIHEMGPKGGDEVNIIEEGKNYGWPFVSEGAHYDDTSIPNHNGKAEFVKPLISWNPSISPAGLLFYTGDKIKEWKGKAILGGLSSEALIVLSIDGDKVSRAEEIKMGKRIREVAESPDGALLLLTDGDNGELLRLTSAASTSD